MCALAVFTYRIHMLLEFNQYVRCVLIDFSKAFEMVDHAIPDLVMTFAGCPLDEVTVDPSGIISDYALVVSHLPVAVGHAAAAERLVRGWRPVDRDHSSPVPSANRSRMMQTSTSYSLPTTACFATSLTVLHHNTLFATALGAWRRGSTPTVAPHVATVVVWSAVIDRLCLRTIDVLGSPLFEIGSGCTELKRRHTG